MSVSDEVLAHALALGFDAAAVIAPIGAPSGADAFTAWLAAGYHGEMVYMADTAAARRDSQLLAPGARSMIVTLVNYHPGAPPEGWTDPLRGRMARYAWAPDYHDVIKPLLFRLDAFIRERTGRAELGRACVDTAPLLERDFAAQAGLGFFGRNTCLITPRLGSWTFLAALLIPEQLDNGVAARDPEWAKSASSGTCGRCTRCLDACPTAAFVGSHALDARRCISYLTIELRGPIPRELRPLMGNWVFGCDVCQEVCPYNRQPPVGGLSLATQPALPLANLLALDDAGFRARYRGTPLMRAKRRGLVRNACVAAGNAGDRALSPALTRLLTDDEPLVRGHAAWALGRIGGRAEISVLHDARSAETDPYVIDEIETALF